MHLLVRVVNNIRVRALNHRQFQSLLDDKDAEYRDMIYRVLLLRQGKILKGVWEISNEILFLDRKGNSCEFITKTGCDECRYEMMFEADMFDKLTELDMTSQRKGAV